MRLIFVQPALPAYRKAFFDQVAQAIDGQIKVYYSPADMGALTERRVSAAWAFPIGPIHVILPGLCWQSGIATLPLSRGDVLALSGNPRFLSTLFLLLRARYLGVKTVLWGHYWSSTSRPWRHALRLFMLRAGDALLFYTEQEIEEYRVHTQGRDRRIISALNNGVDLTPIRPVRLPYHAAQRARALLFVGRLTAKAQLRLALEALSKPELGDLTLHVIGWGEEGPQLRRKAHALGLGQRVHWHGATTVEAEIAAIANNCRLFLYPGQVGLSLIHAMAYGLPAIIHSDRLRHMPEIAAFAEGKTGRSFVPDDPIDLARAVRSVIDETETLDQWSSTCVQLAEMKYNTIQMSERLLAVVRQLQEDDAQCV